MDVTSDTMLALARLCAEPADMHITKQNVSVHYARNLCIAWIASVADAVGVRVERHHDGSYDSVVTALQSIRTEIDSILIAVFLRKAALRNDHRRIRSQCTDGNCNDAARSFSDRYMALGDLCRRHYAPQRISGDVCGAAFTQQAAHALGFLLAAIADVSLPTERNRLFDAYDRTYTSLVAFKDMCHMHFSST